MEELKTKEIESKEVMEILHISKPTLAVWLRDGKLKPSRRAGRKLLFDREYIENFGREV
jgi:predicted site-specific integrase-resolvase